MKQKILKSVKDNHLKVCANILAGFGIKFSVKDVQGSSRDSRLIFKRALIVLILRNEGLSLQYIGNILHRNHATIINLESYEKGTQCRDKRYTRIKKILSTGSELRVLQGQLKQHEKESAIIIGKIRRIKNQNLIDKP